MDHEERTPSDSILNLDEKTRTTLWQWVSETVESYVTSVDNLPIAPKLDAAAVRDWLESFGFQHPIAPVALLEALMPQWKQQQVHTAHPGYFGLFNPAPSQMSIVADALVAALNPQLAAWSHSPLAVEIERHLVRSFGERFGFEVEQVDGEFTTGGAEANLTALLVALHHRWPTVAQDGLRSLPQQPVFYVSREGHHSFLKAARASGLGAGSLREIDVTADLAMDVESLKSIIRQDRAAGRDPFLLIATAGTTGAGAIDPLHELENVAREEKLWFHVDAAWGGAAALSPRLAPLIKGIEAADSITFDAHKWLSVSMGAGIFITRHREVLSRTFGTQTTYMPREGRGLPTTDPFTHSIQWSRRFIGLKAFLSLAVAGWDGYARVLEHQTDMGALLRKRLNENSWSLVNDTPLPVVCFNNASNEFGIDECQRIVDDVISAGRAWISTIQLGQAKRPAIRACITNFKTQPCHVSRLIDDLNHARATIRASG